MASTIGQKELRNDWDELTASDPTKFIGHEQTLEPENNLIPIRERAGL